MKRDIDELVANIPQARAGSDCWAKLLTGRAAEFLAAVKDREMSGVTLHRNAILDTLNTEFGVKIGQDALTRHLKGRCKCV
jgi:hypothetical protein